jgi:hypothetical protein
MSTLTGQSISASYLGLIHLATNTQIANNTNTQLQDGAGNNIGVFVNTNGTLTATNFSGSLTGTASNATFALTARSSSYAQQATSASSANYASIAGATTTSSFAFFAVTASHALNVPATASFATSASYANNAGAAQTAISASYAQNAATFPYTGSAIISGSLFVSGTITQFKNFNTTYWSDAVINNVSFGTGRWSGSASGSVTAEQITAASSSFNIAIGSGSLGSNEDATFLTAIGYQALANAGTYKSSGETTSDGRAATAVGYRAGFNSSVRFGLGTYIGAQSGQGDAGARNVGVGYRSMASHPNTSLINQGGWDNVGIGVNSLLALYGTIADPNVPLNLSASRNVAVGADAGAGIYWGNDNIALGYRTLNDFDGGKDQNIAIGSRALQALQRGQQNTFIGWSNEVDINNPNLISGSRNIIIGSDFVDNFTSGSGNTIIGNAIDFTPFTTLSNTTLNNTIILASGNGSVKALHSGSTWFLNNVSGSFTGSLNGTASFATTTATALTATSASFATTAALATTASYALGGNFVGLGTNNTFTGTQTYNNTVTYTAATVYSSSVAAKVNELAQGLSHDIDLSTGNMFALTLQTGSNSITVSNIQKGVSGIIQLKQPASGYASVSFSSAFDFPSGSAFTGSVGSNAIDIVSFVSFDGGSLKTIIGGYNFI